MVFAGTTTVVLFGGGGSDELKLKQPPRDSGRIKASRKRHMMWFLNVELAETHALWGACVASGRQATRE